MYIRATIPVLACLLVFSGSLRAQQPKEEPLPVVILFPPVMPELIAHDRIGAQVAIALKQALQETGRCEPFVFNPESLLVQRAVTERKLSESDLKRVTSASQALKIASASGVPYLIYGSILAFTPPTKKNPGILTISLAAIETEGQKAARFTLEGSIPAKGDMATHLIEPARKITQEMVQALTKMAADRQKIQEKEAERIKQITPPVQANTGGAASVVSPPRERGDPKESLRHMSLGDTYISRGEIAQAILEYRTAVSLNPWNGEAREKLIRAYERKKLSSLAAEEASRALSFDPDNSKLAKLAISFYLEEGNFDQAEESLKEILNAKPNEKDLRIALGDVYWNQGKLDDATRQYEQVLIDDPQNTAAHERLAKLLAARGQYAESLTHLTASQQGSSSDPYQAGARIIDSEMSTLIVQLEGINNNATNARLVRSEASLRCKTLRDRAEGLSKFLESLNPSEDRAVPHRQRRFALSLLLQALDLHYRYYEGNNPQDRDQAALLLKEARNELKNVK